MDDYFLNEMIDEHTLYRVNIRENKYMAKNNIVFAKGTLYWSKIVGRSAAVPNYEGDGYEWTFEVEPDDVGFLKDNGLLDRLKDPLDYVRKLEKRIKNEDDPETLEELETKLSKAQEQAEGRGDYLILRKPTENKDGEPTEPFRIYDEDNEPWGEDRLIGNGSKADLKLKIVDWGPGKKKSIYCMAIRVTALVTYETDEFAAMDNDAQQESKPKRKAAKPKKADTKGKAQELDELDDDIPF